ncbi:MAG: FmdE family protein [Candidatus Zixiibacteriota bacterium]
MSEAQIESMLKEIGYFRRILGPGVAYGAKMTLAAKEHLKIKDLKKANLFVVVETDHCLPDAIQFLCGCTIGNRRLIVKDYGKMAATFIDRDARRAIRITISPTLQERDIQHSQELIELKKKRMFEEIESHRLHNTLEISKIPDEELLRIQEVEIIEPLPAIFLPTGIVSCEKCGESTRESKIQIRDGKKLCFVCAGVEKPYFKLKYGEVYS